MATGLQPVILRKPPTRIFFRVGQAKCRLDPGVSSIDTRPNVFFQKEVGTTLYGGCTRVVFVGGCVAVPKFPKVPLWPPVRQEQQPTPPQQFTSRGSRAFDLNALWRLKQHHGKPPPSVISRCDRRELCSRWWLLSAVLCALNQVSLLLLAKNLKKAPNSSSGR